MDIRLRASKLREEVLRIVTRPRGFSVPIGLGHAEVFCRRYCRTLAGKPLMPQMPSVQRAGVGLQTDARAWNGALGLLSCFERGLRRTAFLITGARSPALSDAHCYVHFAAAHVPTMKEAKGS